MTKSVLSIPETQAVLSRLKKNIGTFIRGKDHVIDQVLTCLVASGHLLIEDLPGLGKTTLAYCLARSIDCDFTRLQFTSDLLPSDVIGVSVYDESQKTFVFKHGPIFTNILLADEINRTTPKTQSALLEVMDRSKVSVDGQTHHVHPPFMVFATQNPVDYEGTFPLPESQMDRFLMRIRMGYPGEEDELTILQSGLMNYDEIDLQAVANKEDIMGLQQTAWSVFVEESVLRYMLGIITATREEPVLKTGVSTRGGLALKLAAQARALLQGRDFVIPEDIAVMTKPILTHRLTLQRQTADTLEERRLVEEVLQDILDRIPKPM